MNRNDFLNWIIDDGTDEVRRTYTKPEDSLRLQGALEGFEACRGCSDEELLRLLKEARAKTKESYEAQQREIYWKYRMYELQIEWVLNVLSAALYLLGERPLLAPTARGALKAAQILKPQAR